MGIEMLGVKEVMSSKLYHKEIGFPDNIQILTGHMDLEYSRHAMDEASGDKYGGVDLPEFIDFQLGNVIEIEVDNDKVIKMVVRVSYDEEKDLVLVIIPQNGLVKTVWFNTRGDKHRTLDKWRYTNPKQVRW